MKFTAKTIDAVRLPAGKRDHIEWDDELPGFGVRLREGGSRGWVFQYQIGTQQRRMSLGAATTESLKTIKDAKGDVVQIGIRERVAQLQARVKLGEDPAGVKIEKRQKAAETFEVIGRRWLAARKTGENREKIMRPATYAEAERHILKYCSPLHSLHFASIEQSTIATRLNQIAAAAGDVTANRVRTSLSAMYGWAGRQGVVSPGHNPVASTGKSEEKPRERTLTDDELREIWKAAGDDHYGSIIRLLMLTGQRADEIGRLSRSEIGKAEVPKARRDGLELPAFTIDAIDLPSERTKNGRPHVIPLSKPALAILERQPVRADDDGNIRNLIFGVGQGGFSGWSKSKERLDERIHAARVKEAGGRGDKVVRMPHWTPHDLRRTMDTKMNETLGVLPHVVEAILNHVSSGKSGKAGVAGTYNKAVYLRERVEALRLWADHIMALVGENVVPLRAAFSSKQDAS